MHSFLGMLGGGDIPLARAKYYYCECKIMSVLRRGI